MKFLIVEDQLLILQDICALIEDAGASACTQARTIEEALTLIDGIRIDGAVLDVNLGNVNSSAVAVALNSRSIPFIVVTGYDGQFVPPELRRAPYLSKPFTGPALVDALQRMFVGRQRA